MKVCGVLSKKEIKMLEDAWGSFTEKEAKEFMQLIRKYLVRRAE